MNPDQGAAELYVAGDAREIQRAVERELAFSGLPDMAQLDAAAALGRVSPESQTLFALAAEDARMARAVAEVRLTCLWVTAAAVNLADDIADGDCDYLEPRVAPGVSFLLQALAGRLVAKASVSEGGAGAFFRGLMLAAGGQSLEVRSQSWSLGTYREVARLIAGEQYAAYLCLLWDGTLLEERAAELGRAVGVVGFVATDIATRDQRFLSLSLEERHAVLDECAELVTKLEQQGMPSLDVLAKYCKSRFPDGVR